MSTRKVTVITLAAVLGGIASTSAAAADEPMHDAKQMQQLYEGDMDALAVRWPDWNARIAGFLMHDPLRALRDELGRRLQAQDGDMPQRLLFPLPPAGEGAEGG